MNQPKETPPASATGGADQNNIVFPKPSGAATPSQLQNKSFPQAFQNIPAELQEREQWVCWRFEIDGKGRMTKVPYNAATGYHASIDKPETWGTFNEACSAVATKGMDGIGFVLTVADPYAGIDIDDKVDNPASEHERTVHAAILANIDSYTERSPGERWKDEAGNERGGFHVIVRGRIDSSRDRGHVGLYSSKRYLTFTGDVVRSSPINDYQLFFDNMASQMPASAGVELEDVESSRSDAEVHEMACNAANGDKYEELCTGDWAGMGYPSQSEADHALLSIIAFYTPSNEQVRHIFRCTGLGKREKANEGDRYLNTSLKKIRAKQSTDADLVRVKADAANWIAQAVVSNAIAPAAPSQTLAPAKQLVRASSACDYVKLTNAASIKPEPIRWLCPGYLARGKLHVLAGSPGTGKTTIAVDFAASTTSGRAFPTGHRPTPANTLIWSGEDDPADTLVPRLIAAGADLNRVHFVGDIYKGDQVCRSFDPAHDVEALATAAANLENVELIIIDPLVSAVSGDSHKNAEVRRGLQPLVELAAKLDAALLGITHYSKGTQMGDPLERVTGSIAFGAMARIVYGTVRMRAEDGETARMVLARAKSNIGPDGGGFAYSFQQRDIEGGISTSYIEWGERLEGSARDLLAEPEQKAEHRGESSNAAVSWLIEVLQEGPKLVKDVRELARTADIKWRSVERASQQVAMSERRGFGAPATWFLPGSEWQSPILATSASSPSSPTQNATGIAVANVTASLTATKTHGENGENGENAAALIEGGRHG
ncbi:AAA family ATPase [Rhodanobacter sp. Col0626]|uniref:AAA family ATPase n=1 Tax=Rhodanobacter sp. Col0626 TaxID=3415679 RepID=UPI003CFA33CD